jgi:hypothetical protein
MNVRATRDSVAAGDDADAPHARLFSLADSMTILELVSAIAAQGYLASIRGGRATWSVVSGVPLAVVAQQWSEPRAIPWIIPALSDLDWRDGALCVHFNYHSQLDPDIVLEVLKGLQLHAPAID